MVRSINKVLEEVNKVVRGKEEITAKVFMAICASGHVLLEDNPGSGKTTLAKSFSRAIALDYKRIQFTPDTMPSDITGYSYFKKGSDQMEYMPGAVQCNLLLGDEINRTSAKTQSALLEAMEEGSVTLDGKTTFLPQPFIVIATQNPATSLGTQPLPDSQCDRFMVKLSMGYPSLDSEMQILRETSVNDITTRIDSVMTAELLQQIRGYVDRLKGNDELIKYICELCDATRHHDYIDVGVSTRGAIALERMAAAHALFQGRGYIIPEDVREVFIDVCAHRIILKPRARMEDISEKAILEEILNKIKPGVVSKK
ncbi:MAG: MoxR family ATPase [Lachnospiraceae bacterium]|nr:MoxR family ATPase [Lachnospiraceae bacterium]